MPMIPAIPRAEGGYGIRGIAACCVFGAKFALIGYPGVRTAADRAPRGAPSGGGGTQLAAVVADPRMDNRTTAALSAAGIWGNAACTTAINARCPTGIDEVHDNEFV